MKKILYLVLGTLTILVSSCFYERLESSSLSANNQEAVLSLNIGTALSPQPQNSFEDKIEKVHIYILNSTSNKIVYQNTLTHILRLNVRLIPGKYDFYFIANSDQTPNLNNPKTGLDNLLKSRYRLPTDLKTIPMARVYRNQIITAGGTVGNPLPFKPQLDTESPLEPISSYGKDESAPGFAALVRSLAKINIKFTGGKVSQIQQVSLIYGSDLYSLKELKADGSNISSNTISFKKNENDQFGPIYIPERVFEDKTVLGWKRDKENGIDEPIGGVYYIKVEMKDKTIYKIPVISNEILPSDDYLAIARDKDQADYNVKRNFIYDYEIKLPIENRELEIISLVNPWNVSNYTTNFDEPNVRLTYKNSAINNQQTLETNDQEPLIFKLNIKNANGAIWKLSLTNGADFEIRPSSNAIGAEIPAVMGVADENTTYSFSIYPLKPYQGLPRFSELYLVVNNQEKSLFNAPENGPGNRILIKQVMDKN